MPFADIIKSPRAKWIVLILPALFLALPAARLFDVSGGDDMSRVCEDGGGFYAVVSTDQFLLGVSQSSPYATLETARGRFDTLDLPGLTHRGPPSR
jgi:hypothetical protein